jgi:Na+/H+ antiporter NhaC
MRIIIAFLLLISFFAVSFLSTANAHIEIKTPKYIFTSIEHKIELLHIDTNVKSIRVNNRLIDVNYNNSTAYINYIFKSDEKELEIETANEKLNLKVSPIPLWLSVFPPLIAILLALAFKEVNVSLLIGILSGAWILGIYTDGIEGIFSGFFRLFDTYILEAAIDPDHMAVIFFSLLIGGMVNLISKNGGMHGMVQLIEPYAKTRKNAQFATWLMGVCIFFDDYANTLVVGNTMRPLSDKLKISREKLAYLVDSTAAPIAAIGFISTWVGAELSYIQSGIENIPELASYSAYSIFIQSLAYSFYPIFTLVFMLMLIYTQKDFGPMHKAEQLAINKSNIITNYESEKGSKSDVLNALIPIFILISGTFSALLYSGYETAVWQNNESGLIQKLSETIGMANPYQSLLWASGASLCVALLMSISKNKIGITKAMESIIDGFKIMLTAVLILLLAWALSGIAKEMHTAHFISSLFNGNVSPYFMPAISFIIAAFVAFSTGSSWGAMAILYPLMLPATWLLCTESNLSFDTSMLLFLNATASVLAGAVLGDHCSPISDTTILSSLATECNHIEHVRTQMPYALIVGAVALLFGIIPCAFGLPVIVAFIFGFALLWFVLKFFGKRI